MGTHYLSCNGKHKTLTIDLSFVRASEGNLGLPSAVRLQCFVEQSLHWHLPKWFITCASALGMAADWSFAIILILALSRSRSGMKRYVPCHVTQSAFITMFIILSRTDSMVDTLVLYSITTGRYIYISYTQCHWDYPRLYRLAHKVAHFSQIHNQSHLIGLLAPACFWSLFLYVLEYPFLKRCMLTEKYTQSVIPDNFIFIGLSIIVVKRGHILCPLQCP